MASLSGQTLANNFLSNGSKGSSVRVGQVVAPDLQGPATAAKSSAILLSDSAPTDTNHVGIGPEVGGGVTLKSAANVYSLGSAASAPSFSMDGKTVLSTSATDPDGKLVGSRAALSKVSSGTAAGAAINFGTYADASTLYCGVQKTSGGDLQLVASDGLATSNIYQFGQATDPAVSINGIEMLNITPTHTQGQCIVDRLISKKVQTGNTAAGLALSLGVFSDANTVFRGIQTNAAGDVQIMASDGVLATNSHTYSFTEGPEPSLAVSRQLGAFANWLGGSLGGPAGFVTTPVISNVANFTVAPSLVGTPMFIRVAKIVFVMGQFTAEPQSGAVASFQFGCDQLTVSYADALQIFGGFVHTGNAIAGNPYSGSINSVPAAPRALFSYITAPGGVYGAPALVPFMFMAFDNDPS